MASELSPGGEGGRRATEHRQTRRGLGRARVQVCRPLGAGTSGPLGAAGTVVPVGGSHARPGTQGQRVISLPRPRRGTAWVGVERATWARLGPAVLSSHLPTAQPVGAAPSEPSGKPPPNPLNQHNRVGGGPPEESAVRSHMGCGSGPRPRPPQPRPTWGPLAVPGGHTRHRTLAVPLCAPRLCMIINLPRGPPLGRHSGTVPSPKAAPFSARGPGSGSRSGRSCVQLRCGLGTDRGLDVSPSRGFSGTWGCAPPWSGGQARAGDMLCVGPRGACVSRCLPRVMQQWDPPA